MSSNNPAPDQATSEAVASCPECGALHIDGLTCWEQLGAILAWEWQDPALQAQHFLTVASYNLQHPAQFTDEALAGLRALYVEHLDRGAPVAELRHRVGRLAEGSRRILKPENERRPVLRRWRLTVADVYQAGDPAGAAQRVRDWAESIREELSE